MRSSGTSRSRRIDLLARPPCGVRMYEDGWKALLIDPVEQLVALADLQACGLLSSTSTNARRPRSSSRSRGSGATLPRAGDYRRSEVILRDLRRLRPAS